VSPFMQSAPASSPAHVGTTAAVADRNPASTDYKILLVEDSPTELAILRALFQAEGFDVVTARDGQDALDKLSRERPRMILLDVILPGTNGFSICRQIRSDSEFRDTPIILVTSKNQPSDRFWGLKQGATDYVTKPWNAVELVQTVRRHL
jgi:DNA-binding response OmpR family regulator